MRTVEASRFVRAPPPAVRRHLGPRTLVENGGTFRVRDVAERGDGWRVSADARGVTATFDVRETGDGYVYEQAGEAGPFAAMETTVELAPRDEGTAVTMRSSVSLGLPLPALTDRVAAWKRRGELRRALDALADAVT